MQLKKIKRAEKKGTESVMDEKFSLQFQSSFAVGHGDVVFSVRNFFFVFFSEITNNLIFLIRYGLYHYLLLSSSMVIKSHSHGQQ